MPVARRNPLLADDMGTGKTCQAIVTYLLMREQGFAHRLLIVCPKNVLWTWVHEFNKVMHSDVLLSAVVYHGYNRHKYNLAQTDIVLVTYDTMRNDIEKLEKIRWGLIILDEIHNIRNIDTGKYKASMRLKADFFLGLSGTPLVNSIADIHSIMSRLNPSLLGPRSKFDATYATGYRTYGGVKYNESEWAYNSIRSKVSPVMIRRTMEDVLTELPEFHRIERWVSLEGTRQGKNYDKLVEDGILEYMDVKDKEVKVINVRSHILALFTRLKQQVNVDFATGESAKIDYLEEMFKEEIMGDNGNRVVVFSQFIKPLNLMESRFSKYSPLRIDGSVDSDTRQSLAARFNDPASPNRLMLAQLTACGEGINLEGGNFAILFDPWWNEAKHQQAFRRIRRVTQKRQQYFIQILTENTIEQKILEIIARKNRAYKGVVEGQADSSQFSLDELEDALLNSGRTQ